MARWMIGEIAVDRVQELEGPLFRPKDVFPDYDAEILERHYDDLVPRHYSPSLGLVIGTVQSYVIRTGSYNVLVDTCCGNDKQRPSEPPFHDLHTPYLERLAALGLRPEDIHFVLCTHLHVDHVGWNTKLENGKWVPTFPKATYLFAQTELDFLVGLAHAAPPGNAHAAQYADSVEPIIAGRRARLLTGAETLIPGLDLEFAPGHTPGHVVLRARSKGASALFTGDVVQHPFQVYRPHWNSAFCASPEQSRATRRRVLGECADGDVLMFPAHFANPYAVKVKRFEDSFAIAA
ncbi:MAG: MBL fold metallo-hydrolase [Pseudomonadota bacterium]|nr:MBL fold metallo-hydrolase [Pseudomonadota bacterium]